MKNKIVLLVAAFSYAASAHAASVSLSYVTSVASGANFDVTVQVNNPFAGLDPQDVVLAYGFNVTVADSSVVAYHGETAGALFTDISQQFSGTPQVAGTFTDFTLSQAGFPSPLILAVLHFTALSTGSTTIGVTSNLTDFNQGLTYATADTLAISSSGRILVVPEPATLTLSFLALGALGLTAARGAVARSRARQPR